MGDEFCVKVSLFIEGVPSGTVVSGVVVVVGRRKRRVFLIS
jgi:hypothetical protein